MIPTRWRSARVSAHGSKCARGAHGIRGLSPEEITALWKQGAFPRVAGQAAVHHALWVLNNGRESQAAGVVGAAAGVRFAAGH